MMAPEPSLVSVGTVADMAQCQNIADHFGRPYFVSIPVDASGHMCFVGGTVAPRLKKARPNVDAGRPPAARPKSPVRREPHCGVTPTARRDGPKRCTADDPHQVGVLTLTTPLPMNHQVDAVYRNLPRTLNLYTLPVSDPWQLTPKERYYTHVDVNGRAIRQSVYRAFTDCLRHGCPRLTTGDVVELRNTFGFTSIQYTVGLFASVI